MKSKGTLKKLLFVLFALAISAPAAADWFDDLWGPQPTDECELTDVDICA